MAEEDIRNFFRPANSVSLSQRGKKRPYTKSPIGPAASAFFPVLISFGFLFVNLDRSDFTVFFSRNNNPLLL